MEIQEYERKIQTIWALFRETGESIRAISQEAGECGREIDERFNKVRIFD